MYRNSTTYQENQVPKLDFWSNSYRYGFQGQEKDDEIKGEGNSVNYTYRMHDTRLGRFFAVDPLVHDFPHNSPYAFSENRVIDAIELEGKEQIPYTSYNNMFSLGFGASLNTSRELKLFIGAGASLSKNDQPVPALRNSFALTIGYQTNVKMYAEIATGFTGNFGTQRSETNPIYPISQSITPTSGFNSTLNDFGTSGSISLNSKYTKTNGFEIGGLLSVKAANFNIDFALSDVTKTDEAGKYNFESMFLEISFTPPTQFANPQFLQPNNTSGASFGDRSLSLSYQTSNSFTQHKFGITGSTGFLSAVGVNMNSNVFNNSGNLGVGTPSGILYGGPLTFGTSLNVNFGVSLQIEKVETTTGADGGYSTPTVEIEGGGTGTELIVD